MRRIEDIVCLHNPKPINYACGSRNYNMFVASVGKRIRDAALSIFFYLFTFAA